MVSERQGDCVEQLAGGTADPEDRVVLRRGSGGGEEDVGGEGVEAAGAEAVAVGSKEGEDAGLGGGREGLDPEKGGGGGGVKEGEEV